MIGYRLWCISLDWNHYWYENNLSPGLNNLPYCKLISPVRGTAWPRSTVRSQTPPTSTNFAGIYCYTDPVPIYAEFCDNNPWPRMTSAFGAVDLGGRVIEHRNGLLRAEYASIVWIGLFYITLGSPINTTLSKDTVSSFESIAHTGTDIDKLLKKQYPNLPIVDLPGLISYYGVSNIGRTIDSITDNYLHRMRQAVSDSTFVTIG